MFVYANWTPPPATPPSCPPGQTGCDVPINVGGLAQMKAGGLIVAGNSGVDPGFIVLNGRIGVGTANPGGNNLVNANAAPRIHVYDDADGGPPDGAYIGFGPEPATGPPDWFGPAANFGYSPVTWGRATAFMNSRGDPGATPPNPSLRFAVDTLERMIVTNTGDVGIGTASNFDVASVFKGGPGTNAPLAGRLQVRGKPDVIDKILFLPGPDTANPGTPDIRVGIGTAAPQFKLDVNGIIRTTADRMYFEGSDPVNMFWFMSGLDETGTPPTNPDGDNVIGWTRTSGNVGRRINLSGSTYVGQMEGPAGTLYDLVVSGKVGIGTVAPTARLEIYKNNAVLGLPHMDLTYPVSGTQTGSFRFLMGTHTTGAVGYAALVSTSDMNAPNFGSDRESHLSLRMGDHPNSTIDWGKGWNDCCVTILGTIKPNGNVGIGTDSPTSKLHVIGKATITGGVDPPYVSYSAETHTSIRNFAKDVEEHEKVMMFWNSDAHRMEVYVIAEDAFYTIAGERVSD